MTTITTRRGDVPIVASRRQDTVELGRTLGVPAHWEVRIAPMLHWTSIPHVLRSTYVCADLATALTIAISEVDSYLEHEAFTPECMGFLADLQPFTRAMRSCAETFVGQPLPSDALYGE